MKRSKFRPFRLAFESLESRTLLAADLIAGVLTVDGGIAADTIVVSQSGDDVLVTLNSVNSLFPLSQVDNVIINGRDSNDTVTYTLDKPVTIDGGRGDDTITSRGILGGAPMNVNGSSGDDTITVEDAGEVFIRGWAGNDTITANSTGITDIQGGVGNDTLTADGASHIDVDGGDGDDTITANNVGSAIIYGGADNDTIVATASDSVKVNGGAGDDSIAVTTAGPAFLYGGSGNDTIISDGAGSSHIFGGDGNDGLTGGFGYNNLDGGSGQDTLNGRGTSNRLRGGPDSDTYTQAGGPSKLFVDALDAYTLRSGLDTAYFEPVLSFSGVVGYVHDAPAVTLAPFARVTDADNSGFAGGRLLVRVGLGSDASNRLSIGGNFTIDANHNVLLGTTVIGKQWSTGVGSRDLRIQFNANGTQAVAQELVRAVKFKTVGGAAGQRDVVFSISDSDFALSAELTKVVQVS